MHKVNLDPGAIRQFRKYFDEAMRLNCFRDLLAWGVFPDAKELTESFGAFHAVRKNLVGGRDEKFFGGFHAVRKSDEKSLDWKLEYKDDHVCVICVGDGSTPRTGATFAVRSNWHVFSVDPNLKLLEKWEPIKRLHLRKGKIEDCLFDYYNRFIVVAVHSHADLRASLTCIKRDSARIAVVAIPCCIQQELKIPPDMTYDDSAILSPQNRVHIWRWRFREEYI